MQNNNTITLSQTDYVQILSLVQANETDLALLLEDELNRAQVVQDDFLPADVVAMNSKVQFIDHNTGKESQVVLVYPKDADIQENKISILSPVGAALIGLRKGQKIQWPFPNGQEKQFEVIAVER